MEPLKTHRGLVATLDRSNVDTDQIIPKQFLKAIGRTGFEKGLFFDWRFKADGSLNPDFELNKPRFKGASVLVARNNFGCGSSRGHAGWAIHQYGFRAVISPSFADIFKNNSAKNSLLTIELPEAEVDEIFRLVERYAGLEATANLDEERLTLHLPEEVSFHFDIDPAVKERLIHGLDDIGITLKHERELKEFESRHDPQIASR